MLEALPFAPPRIVRLGLLSLFLLHIGCGKSNKSEDEAAAVAVTEEIIAPGAAKPEPFPGSDDANPQDPAEKKPGEKQPDPLAVQGAALYAKNCESCHGALKDSDVRGAGVEAIASAIAAVPEMKSLANLPSIDLLSIAKALGSDAGPGKGKGNGKGQGKGMEMKEEKEKGNEGEQENLSPEESSEDDSEA